MKYACHDDVAHIVDIKHDQVTRLSHGRLSRTLETRQSARHSSTTLPGLDTETFALLSMSRFHTASAKSGRPGRRLKNIDSDFSVDPLSAYHFVCFLDNVTWSLSRQNFN
jgi:hypothetical protein